jgi:hypothetical protein
MISCGSRTRLLVIVLVALTIAVTGTRFLIFGRLQSLPAAHAPQPERPSIKPASNAETDPKLWNPELRVPCMGPRGADFEESDDNLHESAINIRKCCPAHQPQPV